MGAYPAVTEWLLEEDQPSVRYLALTELAGRSENAAEVRATRARIARRGWAADQLASLGPKGYWERREPRTVAQWIDFLYRPSFTATFWRALLLADLGLDRRDPRIARIAERIFDFKLQLSSPFNFFHEEACMAGNTARMLTRFGFSSDRRVRKLFDWLIEDQREDGGWNCAQGTPGTLDVWEPLSAFASVPEPERSPAMDRAIERGVAFYLERKLMEEGRRYPPWGRFHFPTYFFYDVLVGLDLVTRLGGAHDRRLRPALELLRDRRRPDGTWAMGPTHPDLGRGVTMHPDPSKVRPLMLEAPGAPSKWITLTALRVLERVGSAD